MRRVRIGLLGCGTVGGGFVHLLERHRERIARRHGVDLAISRILVRDVDKERSGVDPSLLTRDAEQVIGNGCQLVVELIGGNDPARRYIRDSIVERKHVVTANKSVLALAGGDLLDLAAVHGVRVGFEASVGGAIPIVRVIRDSLEGDRVRSIRAILNGTCNYVLTKMEDGTDRAQAVLEAQRRGFTEADPSRDLSGEDAADKLTILARLAWPHAEIHWTRREGIDGLTADQIVSQRRTGKRVRLIAEAVRRDGKVALSVSLHILSARDPLASITGELNGIVLECEAGGALTFFGRGAGSLPSASAVLSDVVQIARG